MRGGYTEQSLGRLHSVLVVLAESTVAAEPCEGALHNPGQSGDLESTLTAFHNLQLPAILTHEVTGPPSAFVSGICDHRIDSRKQ